MPISPARAQPDPVVEPRTHQRDRPKLFLSYARQDVDFVGTLRGDLDQVCQSVWFDQELVGGQQWWDEILEHLRDADIVLFVLSPDSLRSRPCRSELTYASQLRKPILPVQVRDVDHREGTGHLLSTQAFDYRHRTPKSAIELAETVRATFQGPIPLPDPLPDPPVAPIHDLGPLRERLGAAELDIPTQHALLDELQAEAKRADPNSVLTLVETLLARGDELVGAVKKALEKLFTELRGERSAGELGAVRAGTRRRPLDELDPSMVARLRTLVDQIDTGHFTPIIGRGMTDSLIGPMDLLAREWADSYGWPGGLRRSDDLPLAAQFVEVTHSAATLRSALTKGLLSHIVELHGDAVGATPSEEFSIALRAAWEEQRKRADPDPHMALAALPCPVYVVAHPWDLMAAALEATPLPGGGFKEPVVELCHWKPEYADDWPPSVFDVDPDYEPTVERPLVFHVFGLIETSESVVLSEDDYLDFLVNVTRHPDLIPPQVRSVLADSALLLLGFGMEQTDVRVLVRSLISQEGSRRRYKHVGAQSQAEFNARARVHGGVQMYQEYVEQYFGDHSQPSISIFWGTVDEFAAGLAELWSAGR